MSSPDPCVNLWDGCLDSPDGDHVCVRAKAHGGRCRCACGATTTVVDPIYEDPEELEQAQQALDGA